MNTEEAYLVMQGASGIKVGDKVKVLRKADSQEMGWGPAWTRSMDACVGQTYMVCSINGDQGICLSCGWSFPFFVLEKVESASPKYCEPFERVEDNVRVSYCHKSAGKIMGAPHWPIRISILNKAKYGRASEEGEFVPGDLLTCGEARKLGNALIDCAAHAEKIRGEER